MYRHTFILLCACAWVTSAHAQAHCPDSTAVGEPCLGLTVDALAFFKDNEYDGDVVRGYSLPGFRLQPRLTYTPLREVSLEAGLHATIFEGANKYPAYVFHDIAHWKGNQYQHGAHVLPFFRAEARLGQERSGKTTIVLGDIYGATAHGIAHPLYNPELTLTDDPEAGVQILVSRKRWTSDVWLNWQSYIYEEDTHQEAFTVGWTQRTLLPRGFSIPVQVLVQHRGGEQDIPALQLGVQTIANGAVGIEYCWRAATSPASPAGQAPAPHSRGQRGVTVVSCEALGLGALQQSGHLWPFDVGSALWTSAAVDWAFGLRLKAGLFYAPHDFCSLYGSPYFGTLSLKHPGERFDGMTTGYWAVEYARTWAGAYTLSAKVDGYINRGRAPFSFGVYFRACPSFILKRWIK